MQTIQDAMQWLTGLTAEQIEGLNSPDKTSLRIFTEEECESLSLPCRRFLLSLEQQGIVDAALRERIIYHAMELQVKNMDLYVIEGITRIILSRRPNSDDALTRMELLISEPGYSVKH